MPSVLDEGSGYVFSDKVAHTTVARQQQEEVFLQSDIFGSLFSRSNGYGC